MHHQILSRNEVKKKALKMNKIHIIEELGQIEEKAKRREAIKAYLPANTVLEPFTSGVNIVVPSKDPTKKKIVLTAHYDVVRGSKGYNDNLSGVVSLIALQDKIPDNCELVITDNEEIGYLGAEAYALKHKKEILCNINLDIVGIPDSIFYTKYRFPYNVDSKYNATQLFSLPYNDSWAFNAQDIPAIILMTGYGDETSFLRNIWQYMHNGPQDNKLECISPLTLDMIHSATLDLIAEISYITSSKQI